MCLGLCVAEYGYGALVDGGKVYKEHVESATPVISLLRCALRGDVLSGGAEEWGGYVGVCVPLSEGVVDLTCGVRYWEV